jgi:DNA-binding Lrp family transcriptional regulator
MLKTKKEQISNDERKIVLELQKDSDKSIDSIAKKCGLSRQKVSKTIKKLEKDHTIWGYTAIVDMEKLDLKKYVLFIKRTMRNVDSKVAEQTSLDMINENYLEIGITIDSSFYIHGEYDWLIIFTAQDLRYAKRFSNLITASYQGTIEKTTLMEILYSPRIHYIFNPDLKKLKELL